MRTCETCKWFEPCGGDWGSCGLASSYDGTANHEDAPMYALDSEQYIAWLQVKRTHSCAAWEPRE